MRKNDVIQVRYPEERKAKAMRKAKRERTTLTRIITEGLDEYIKEGGNVNRDNSQQDAS